MLQTKPFHRSLCLVEGYDMGCTALKSKYGIHIAKYGIHKSKYGIHKSKYGMQVAIYGMQSIRIKYCFLTLCNSVFCSQASLEAQKIWNICSQ